MPTVPVPHAQHLTRPNRPGTGGALGEPSRGGGAAVPVVGPVGVGAGIGGWDPEPVSGEGWGRHQPPTMRSLQDVATGPRWSGTRQRGRLISADITVAARGKLKNFFEADTSGGGGRMLKSLL